MTNELWQMPVETLSEALCIMERVMTFGYLPSDNPKRRAEAYEVIKAALRGPQPDPETGLKGCWHCINIEAHHIEYVIAVKAKGGRPMNMPVDCPYHYCPACGRKLGVDG